MNPFLIILVHYAVLQMILLKSLAVSHLFCPGTPIPEQTPSSRPPADHPSRPLPREQGHLVNRDCIQFCQPLGLGDIFGVIRTLRCRWD